MPWEHHTEPLASGRIFAGRMFRQFLLVAGVVAVSLAIGTAGYMIISEGSENLDFVDSFLESSMLMSGAGPLYTERTSTNALKLFSSVYALFSTLVVVTTVALLGAPIVHRILHRLHLERRR